MPYRVAINGFGRIGCDYLRCLLDRNLLDTAVTLVAINDLWDAATLAHLLEYDSTFGRLRHTVDHDEASLTVAGSRIPQLRQPDPAHLPWKELAVDLVIESTGRFRRRDQAASHLKAGARRVLISARTPMIRSPTRSCQPPRAPPTAPPRWRWCCTRRSASSAGS